MCTNTNEHELLKNEYIKDLEKAKRSITPAFIDSVVKIWGSYESFGTIRTILTNALLPIKSDQDFSKKEIIEAFNLIDYFYNTHLERVQTDTIADYLVTNKITKAEPEIIDKINEKLKSHNQNNATSALSKFFFLLYPETFPIYDAKARIVIAHCKGCKLERIKVGCLDINNNIYTYNNYVKDIKKLRKKIYEGYDDKEPYYDDFDKFLWLYGHMLSTSLDKHL